jgi:hypothetical protein
MFAVAGYHRQRIDMTVFGTELGGQLAAATEADRRAFDVHQQRRAGARR